MSKVTTALVSFALGVATAFFALSGSHTSTVAQPVFTQGGPLKLEGWEPIVKPLSGNVFTQSSFGGPGLLTFDGLECVDCSFKDVIFEYSGGPIRLVNPKISGPIRIKLNGAAANTVSVIQFLQAIEASRKPPAIAPNKPILRTATAKEVFTADLTTPFGQKQ